MTAGAKSRLKILVVDDDPGIRTLLTDLLTTEGHEVDAATNGNEALQLLLKNRYSFLATDPKLSGTSGLNLIREIRARGLVLPVLLLSNDSVSIFRSRIEDLGCADVISKPFGINEVRSALDRLLTPKEPSPAKRQEKR